ncbi:hypothetical protein AtEden1_Chr5g0111411 [Arabidopsis thaliana]
MSCAADNTTRRGARDGPRAVAPAINEVWCEECSRSSWACLDPALPSSLWSGFVYGISGYSETVGSGYMLLAYSEKQNKKITT